MILGSLLIACLIQAATPQSPPESEIAVLIWHDSPNDRKALVGLKRGLFAMGMASRIREIDVDGDADRAERELRAVDQQEGALVVALGTEAARLAKRHVKRRPVVFTAVTNPVLAGIAASWEGAGGNVAGNSNWLDRGEMLEAFRAAVPELGRLCVLTSRGNAVSEAEFIEAEEAIRKQGGVSLVRRIVEKDDDLAAVVDEACRKADAIWVPIDFQLYQEKALSVIVERARAARKPVVSSSARCAGAGALVVVTVDYEALGLKAASIVKKILVKKESPGRIPVGRLSSARIFVDLDAFRAIGREIPLDLVFKAHRVLGKVDGR